MNAAPLKIDVRPGMVVTDGDGTNYVVTVPGQSRGITLVRQIPKVRGKALRKALKKQRQAVDRRLAHLARQNERPAVDWNTGVEADAL